MTDIACMKSGQPILDENGRVICPGCGQRVLAVWQSTGAWCFELHDEPLLESLAQSDW